MRVLVIDDDPTVQDMLDLVLGLEGFEVHLATDGHSGLRAAFEVRPDVIVLDVMMPGLDGWAVAARLAEQPQLQDIPIVFCTALAGDEETWAGWRTGAASYVTKPFQNDQLVSEVVRAASLQPA